MWSEHQERRYIPYWLNTEAEAVKAKLIANPLALMLNGKISAQYATVKPGQAKPATP